MPGSESHRGAGPDGLGLLRGDARIERITELLLEHDIMGRSVHRPAQDFLRSAQLQLQGQHTLPFVIGTIIHAIPHLNWYKVQLGEGGGWIGACHLAHSTCGLLGPREGNPYPSGARVLVFKPRDVAYGIILGAIPYQLEDGRVAVPGWLAQGSGVGLKREAAHMQPLRNMFRQGGVIDFSCQSPLDATSLDKVIITETGVTFLVSPFEAQLSVNEMCGLFLNLWDDFTALAGRNLEITSAAHELRAGHDEGENRLRELISIYPWEPVGLYAPGPGLTAVQEDMAVQYHAHKGKIDLPDGEEDIQPIYRVQHHYGYEGQGGLRSVMCPTRTSGKRRYSDRDQDVGLFCESIGLDGSYLLQSAKAIILAKRCKISVPRQVLPDESGAGDGAAYKSSSFFGEGPDHAIGDVLMPSAPGPWRVAGVEDLIAHAVNWKRLHPFSYRVKDYYCPQESEDPVFARLQELLGLDELGTGGYLQGPSPVLLHIDHRYQDVAYFMRESFLAMLDDGSVCLGGGAGEQIHFAGGKVRIEAPGGLELVTGGTIVLLADDVVLRAQSSVDISAGQHDVHIYAAQNLQLGAGAGALIEAKGTGRDQDYRDKVGEDVRSSGVVIKSASDVGVLAEDIYLRSGATSAGNIVLDAAQMSGDVLVQAANFSAFLLGDLSTWHFSSVAGEVIGSHRLAPAGVEHAGDCSLGGSLLVGACATGSLLVNGTVGASGNINAGGRMADSKGAALGLVAPSYVAESQQVLQQACQGLRATMARGGAARQQAEDEWQAALRLGNADVREDIGFSYRDADSAGAQYRTTGLQFLECRWQALTRLGGASGGGAWQEGPVAYQGRLLWPWPGRVKWAEDPVFMAITGWTMYGPAAGQDVDRPGPYEAASLDKPLPLTMAAGLRIIPRKS